MIEIKLPSLNTLPLIKGSIKTIHKGRQHYINKEIPKICAVYFLFDSDRKLLYIGQTNNLFARISCHISTKIINFEWISYIECSKSARLRFAVEQFYIHYYKPKLMSLNIWSGYQIP